MKLSMKIVLIFMLSFLTLGCYESFNNLLTGVDNTITSSHTVSIDDFTGSAKIQQKPVSASSASSQNAHYLGFTWLKDAPEDIILTVYVEADTFSSIHRLEMNVDGETLRDIYIMPDTSDITQLSGGSRRYEQSFRIPLKSFEKIARGSSVKMRLGRYNGRSLSSFGTSDKATVNLKFGPFLEDVYRFFPR